MLKPHHFLLLASMLADAGPLTPQTSSPRGDAGTVFPPSGSPSRDAGAMTSPPATSERDAGPGSLPDGGVGSIHWPENLRPLATLDGPAVLAAHAVLQRVLSRFPKEYAGTCSYSAKALEVIVGEEGGLYFVRVNRREDKCGWVAPGVNTDLDWFEMYAVSQDGRILERYPYFP
ncbi:MAG: hypothetical protein ACJ8AT_03070 [Hyalangium sp.]|uniref:hypothetical protein n=1 Tax=Hyalangium sp. TaxID=2028555 RepID=UPI00389A3A5E